MPESPRAASFEEIARSLPVTLPPSTRILGYDRQQGMDEAIRVKLQMTPSDWKLFLASLQIAESDLTEGQRAYLGPSDGWWDPDSSPDLAATQIPLPNAEYLNVGAATGDSDEHVTVYLSWFQT